MFRYIDAKGNRRTGFSFSRLALNSFPNFANTGTSELTLADKDLLFDFQVGLSHPKKLTAATLYITRCALNDKNAQKVFDRLLELNVITNGGEGVDTRNIKPNFTHQMAIQPQHLQKRTVCLLFEWEEELMRYASSYSSLLLE